MKTKLKTNSAAKKRFQIRPSGKVKHKRASLRHNAGAKSEKQKRHLKGMDTLQLRDEKKIKELFPFQRRVH